MSMFRQQYINNVKDYFTRLQMNETELAKYVESQSVFVKEAYKLLKMVKNQEISSDTNNLIDEQIKIMDQTPISYFEIRMFFG